jgi:hypothetical protein
MEMAKRGGIENTKVGIDITAKNSASKHIKKVTEDLIRLNREAEKLKRGNKSLGDSQVKFTETIRYTGLDGYRKTLTYVNGELKRVNKTTNKVEKNTTKLLKSVARVGFYRAVRTFITFLTSGIKENVELMAQLDDSVNNTMSRFNSASKATQASVALIALPFYELASKVLPFVAKVLARVGEAFSYVYAQMTGSDTYLKVNTQYWEDYAKSVEAAKKQLFGFDKFNSLNATQDPGKLFEEAEKSSANALEETSVIAGFVAVLLGLGKAVELVINKFNKKNNKLKKQTELTKADSEAVGVLSSAFEVAKNTAGVLAGAAGLGWVIDQLGKLKSYNKGGENAIDIPLGITTPSVEIFEQIKNELLDIEALPAEIDKNFNGAFEGIKTSFGKTVSPLPAEFTTLTSLALLHFGQEARGELQAVSDAANSYFSSSANSMWLSYKSAIDKVSSYYNTLLGGGDVVVEDTAKNPETTTSPTISTQQSNLFGVGENSISTKIAGAIAWLVAAFGKNTEANKDVTKEVKELPSSLQNTFKNALKGAVAVVGAGAFGAVMTQFGADMGLDLFPGYAGGGIAERGTVFRAGENGAEVVSYLGGGNTGVMNIAQFEEASYRGVSRALYDNRGIFEQEIHGDVYMNGDRVGKVAASGVYKEGVRVGYFEKR